MMSIFPLLCIRLEVVTSKICSLDLCQIRCMREFLCLTQISASIYSYKKQCARVFTFDLEDKLGRMNPAQTNVASTNCRHQFSRNSLQRIQASYSSYELGLILGYANVTLNEVVAQKNMVMLEDGEHPNVTSTTFFVPHCKFPRPYRGNLYWLRQFY